MRILKKMAPSYIKILNYRPCNALYYERSIYLIEFRMIFSIQILNFFGSYIYIFLLFIQQTHVFTFSSLIQLKTSHNSTQRVKV